MTLSYCAVPLSLTVLVLYKQIANVCIVTLMMKGQDSVAETNKNKYLIVLQTGLIRHTFMLVTVY